MTETYICYYYPGFLTSETSKEKVKDRTIPNILPRGCYCFYFYDLETTHVGQEPLTGKPKNFSKYYYPGGSILTLDDIEKQMGKGSTLYSNMKCNEWNAVVKSKMGNFQPYDPKEVEII
jgi:hypothetical protein